MSETPEIIRAQREAIDPHHRIGNRGLIYCNISQRTEGTVRMEGRKCSFCGFEFPDEPR